MSLVHRKKVARTLGMHEVIEFMPIYTALKMQGINRLFYERFALILVTSVSLYRQGAYCLLTQQSCIKVFDCYKMQWNDRQITEEGDTKTPQQRQEYFDK